MSSTESSSSPSQKPQTIDPILRNALRYTVSAKEYKLLHQYLITRAPVVRKRTPPPPKYEAIVQSGDDYNAAAIRASVRVGVASFAGLKAWELIMKFLARGKAQSPQRKVAAWKSPNVRLSSSLAFILLFHRLLHRFFTRLRQSLLTDEAKPFRRRNPRVSKSLTARVTPAIGASLAGFFLAVYPADQLRITIAIYVFTQSLEFLYNALEDRGWFKNRPWWFGSWMLMPVTCGQLLHAFVFDRDCFPAAYGDFIMKNSPEYIQQKPEGYGKDLKWPGTYEIVDSLAEISKMKWPPFISPILFPGQESLPKSIRSMSPITSPAHPAIKNLSCALLHPNDPSCMRIYISYYIRAFPPVARFLTMIFGALSVLRWRSFVDSPVSAVNGLAKSILRMSLFITGAIGTSWGSICLFNSILPRTLLATQRWFLGGFLGGCWAFLERKTGRSNFLYSMRLSIDSLWKVGVKRRWWRGVKNGDVLLFALSLALVNTIYEVNPKAISSGVLRKGLGVLRGDGWVDRAASALKNEKVIERDQKAEGLEVLEGELEEKQEQARQ